MPVLGRNTQRDPGVQVGGAGVLVVVRAGAATGGVVVGSGVVVTGGAATLVVVGSVVDGAAAELGADGAVSIDVGVLVLRGIGDGTDTGSGSPTVRCTY
ncbi:hypothetical protein [Tsukamurella sp. PLM1]|uniref:hypothetical protein n=1 Tax=Tsukamurella sp. PLM1 TaxID=2929795 RepID=UPI002067039A|nr:hypothetical protein [Tsukamurella sp. PLM1]BDH59393.1 hypothetical protein MTP03_43320 [Tsukamurella sp. PLM1]